MIESIIVCVCLATTEVTHPPLDFQNYDGYIYPEEKGGQYLEGPLSSEWIEKKEEINNDK